MIANTDLTIKLPDGRRLGYAEYGDPAGKAVLHFHGTPDSRLEGTLPGLAESAARLGVRLILPDRPGFGLSDFKRGRTVLDWPEDVLGLADALGFEHFAIMGLSGGGPYAAACAYKIPQRLSRVGIVSGVGPPEMPGAMEMLEKSSDGQAVKLGSKSPWLLRLVLAYTVFQFRRDPHKMVSETASQVSPPDQAALKRSDVAETVVRMTAGAFQQGGRGAAWDYTLFSRPWGFSLGDIRLPVYLWHGEDDWICPAQMGRYVAQNIPGCQATFYPGEGHISLVVNHFAEILQVVAKI
jgi:pimeloyl-ACP methyl ester carboxylesterase